MRRPHGSLLFTNAQCPIFPEHGSYIFKTINIFFFQTISSFLRLLTHYQTTEFYKRSTHKNRSPRPGIEPSACRADVLTITLQRTFLCSVMVSTSALQAEGPRFDSLSRQPIFCVFCFLSFNDLNHALAYICDKILNSN